MIEVIYKDEKQEAKGNEGIFSVPKNIRQIGLIKGDCRIYMEDYVYTFLGRYAGAEENGGEKSCLAVLAGETKWDSGADYVFIKGALSADTEELSREHIEFTDQIWQKIHQEMETYFEGQEIVGWFFSERGLSLEASEIFQRTHLKNFGGGDKVLMLMDPAEREEAFFRYENNFLVKQSGYYLYYEKNPQMQAYMLEKKTDREQRQEEVPDEAVKAFRKIIQKKKNNIEEKGTEELEERTSVFSYAATACLVLAVSAAGLKFYQDYQSIQAVDSRTETVSAVLEAEKPEAATDEAPDKEEEVKKEEKAVGQEKNKMEEKIQENRKRKDTDGEDERQKSTSQKEEEQKKDELESGSQKMGSADDEPKEQGDRQEKIEKETDLASEEQEKNSESIYKQESDIRKAERRVREQQNVLEGKSEETSGGARSYIIRPGDTLYQISIQNYGNMEAVEEICRLNGITADEIIYPGQIIVLP